MTLSHAISLLSKDSRSSSPLPPNCTFSNKINPGSSPKAQPHSLKSCSIPNGLRLSSLSPCDTKSTDAQIYRSTLGSLQYLLHIRPDITFVVNKLSQYNRAPTTFHLCSSKCVLMFLIPTLNLSLTLHLKKFFHYRLL